MKKGFTLVEIMIVVAIIGLLAAIAIPSFMKARTTSQKNACINNLRQIESGKDQWGIENGGTNGFAIGGEDVDSDPGVWTALVGAATGYVKVYPSCPAGASSGGAKGSIARTVADYSANAMGSNPTCSAVGDPHVLP